MSFTARPVDANDARAPLTNRVHQLLHHGAGIAFHDFDFDLATKTFPQPVQLKLIGAVADQATEFGKAIVKLS
ncbi:hypothetical protein IPC720_31155 [Pseudomonas aeruginosa]|nr:hypothetical protein IPC720_31155 [Pseudomonas aeruginosa]